tara:strand:+ start:380 stop:517 length:138 start_codon:yes stop_codon:yes gene_type:complete
MFNKYHLIIIRASLKSCIRIGVSKPIEIILNRCIKTMSKIIKESK